MWRATPRDMCKPSRGAHRYIQHRACRRQSGILVGIYTGTNERVLVSDWVAGGWVILRRVLRITRESRCVLVQGSGFVHRCRDNIIRYMRQSERYIRLQRKRKKSVSESFGNERYALILFKTSLIRKMRSYPNLLHKGKRSNWRRGEVHVPISIRTCIWNGDVRIPNRRYTKSCVRTRGQLGV